MNHSNEVLPTQYKDSSSILSGFLISLIVIRVSCRWREQPTVDFFPHAAAHELSQQGSWDWAQSCVWSLCWQNEATSSMQLTWKLFIPKTPWCHQSGVDEPWPLTALLETNKQTSKQQQQLHKGPNGQMFLSLSAVPSAVMKHQTAENKTRHKGSTKHYCPQNKKVLIQQLQSSCFTWPTF